MHIIEHYADNKPLKEDNKEGELYQYKLEVKHLTVLVCINETKQIFKKIKIFKNDLELLNKYVSDIEQEVKEDIYVDYPF